MPGATDLFRAVFLNSSIGMAVVRSNGEVVLANPSFSEVCGKAGANGNGTLLWDLLSESDRDASRERMSTLSHPGERYSWLAHAQGDVEKLLQLDVSVIAQETGKPLLLANVRDVTLQKTIETRLKQAKESAERATRTKSAFLANMSHEIRTPIHTITGMNELLLETELDAEQKEYAEQIRFSAEVLLGLINDILDFSKIEAGKLTLETIEFPLVQVTEEAVEMLSLEAHKKGLEAIISIGPGLPERVAGDPGRLRQIIVNLFNNAVKFTPGGQIVLSVRKLEESDGHSRLRFEVTDSGIGIPKDKVSRLFKAFHQVDSSTTRKFGGTGLGLSICNSLVGMMGGTIGVESELGRGSTFWFEIPFPVVAGPAPEERICDGSRVLLIDDNTVSREVILDYLDRWGANSATAATGAEALDALRGAAAAGEPFDLALVDLEMPGMDGWQLASEINADKSINSTSLVLLSPTGKMGGDAKMKRLLWFNGYANKPVRLTELAEQIRSALSSDLELADAEGAELVEVVDDEEELRPASLLVAEDHMVNQQLFRTILEKLGHSVIVANNGREAVEKVESESPDLVFMDVQMPELNGYEAAAEIRTKGHTLPIIAVTANAVKGERDKCLAAGMDDFLTKPFKRDDLVPILKRWLPGPEAFAEGQSAAEEGAATHDRNGTGDRASESGAAVAAGEEEFGIPQEYISGDLSGPDAPVFDSEAAVERFMGQREIVVRVVNEFAAKCGATLDALETYLGESAFADLQRDAHGLKGGAWNLEARRLGDAAALLEAAAKMEDQRRCEYYLARLRDVVDEFVSTVESFVIAGDA